MNGKATAQKGRAKSVERARHYIYVCSSGEFVKIGMAMDVRKRVYQMQNANPFKITVEATFPVHPNLARTIELEVHAALEPYRQRRRGEWFKVGAQDAVVAAKAVVDRYTAPPEFTPWEQGIIEKFGAPTFYPSDTPEDRHWRIIMQVLN